MRATEVTIIERASEASPRQRISAARIRCDAVRGAESGWGIAPPARVVDLLPGRPLKPETEGEENVQEAGMGAERS
jgi:hypothetical protein